MNALADNILHFARILRRAGLPIGSGHVIEALRAVEAVGVERRADFRAALFATLVSHPGQREIFDQAFETFWRDPKLLDRAMATLLPQMEVPREEEKPAAGARRLAEALRGFNTDELAEKKTTIELDARDTASGDEILAAKDFEQMSTEELARAQQALASLRWAPAPRLIRRTTPSHLGHTFDLRRTLRRSLKTGGAVVHLERRARQRREPPLVVLCDISGSMSGYARMFLHFLHGLTHLGLAQGRATHTFLFGTRLTNVTRALRTRDPDEALAKVASLTPDWDGGTRIGAALTTFNREWARRVLGQGAVVLLITDGLEREGVSELSRAAEMLHRSARRLIWLNPLLRFDGFAPKAQGVQALLPHVDELRPVHNLNSLNDLARALSDEAANARRGEWKGHAA
ncbi:MAG: VWA domain-containing protein [Alphaproteobacteria bacterium]|nr:VWA domain-containing protein [Alphaproteobacteria bacterium]